MHVTTIPGNRALAFFAVALLSLGAMSAQAAPILSAPVNEVTVNTNGGVNMTFNDPCAVPLMSSQTGQSAGCESGSASADFNALGNASAGGGALHLGASANANSVGTTPYYSNGYASARSVDYFAISGPANTWATLTGSFVLDGALNVQVSGAPQSSTVGLASYNFSASISGASTVNRSGQWLLATNGTDNRSNIAGYVFPVTSTIQFGADGWAVFMISMSASVGAEGNARPYQECSNCALVPGSFSAAANFGNTVYWGGIDSVTVGGVALTDYEYLSSASGVDYRYATSAVPVPAAAWLFGSGLLGLLGAVRRGAKRIGARDF